MTRKLTLFDRLIAEVEHGFATVADQFQESAPSPGRSRINPALSPDEIRKSQGFMRVNHTGEVCAQALYRGQALASRDANLKAHLQDAASEEVDHLLWCSERLKELETFESRLNPLWYLASFLLGFITAQKSDAISLGFVEETEKQVVKHLNQHAHTLPRLDHKSRAIIDVMRDDEARHAENARTLGASDLSPLLKLLMKMQSKVMTQTAYFI